jgi:hypothetical protein
MKIASLGIALGGLLASGGVWLQATYDNHPRTVHEKVLALRAWDCGKLGEQQRSTIKKFEESYGDYWDRVDAIKENYKRNDCAALGIELGVKE